MDLSAVGVKQVSHLDTGKGLRIKQVSHLDTGIALRIKQVSHLDTGKAFRIKKDLVCDMAEMERPRGGENDLRRWWGSVVYITLKKRTVRLGSLLGV